MTTVATTKRKGSKAFEKIMAGLDDAVAYAEGDESRGRVVLPKPDVAAIRKGLGLSQSEFARGFGVSPGTLKNWEQGRRVPDGPARVLLSVIEHQPQAVLGTIWPARAGASANTNARRTTFAAVARGTMRSHAKTFKKLAAK